LDIVELALVLVLVLRGGQGTDPMV